MIKYCLWKWEAGKELLREVLSTKKGLDDCWYEKLVELVVQCILNASVNEENNADFKQEYDNSWDAKNITIIDDGDYQGTLLALIHSDIYQPGPDDYLMTHIYYGSCSVCDTLMDAQSIDSQKDRLLSPRQVDAYMAICKDIVTNMIKPYNYGWRHDDWFDVVEVDDPE